MIESFGISDIGLIRLNNEDAFALIPKKKFFVLADGMGGHQAGEIAANETVFYLCKWIKEIHGNSLKEWIELLNQGIQKANSWVYDLASKKKETFGMGTTLCVALFIDKTLIYAHVGDSRIYRVRKGRITRLTRDHSLKDELIAKGELDESMAATFPYKNVITRAIGTQKTVLPEIQSCEIEPEDIYFLCSDGLTESLKDSQIFTVIKHSLTIKEAAEELILQAKKRGGEDNITIVITKISP